MLGIHRVERHEEGRVYVARPVSCVLIGGCSLISETRDHSWGN